MKVRALDVPLTRTVHPSVEPSASSPDHSYASSAPPRACITTSCTGSLGRFASASVSDRLNLASKLSDAALVWRHCPYGAHAQLQLSLTNSSYAESHHYE